MKKSKIIPKFKIGESVKLAKEFKDDNITLKKGWECYVIDIELTDSKNAELDDIYLLECIDYGFWVSEDYLDKI